MRKQIILLALCLVGVLVSVSSVSAADIYVNASAPAGGDGSSTNPFQNISAGIDLATNGDTVNIADGTYTGTGNTKLTISKNMTITGQSQENTIIDGQNTNWIFTIGNSVALTISNLSLKNSAATDDYGAIVNHGELTCTDCSFTGNTAVRYGGAIYNYEGVVTCDNCEFTDNSAGDDGGAIFNEIGEVTCNNCDFTGNSADDGGAIYNGDEGTLTCTNCDFTENIATYAGGAIANLYNQLTCTGCDFTDNSANRGGAIYNYEGVVTCTDCDFAGNSADFYGGAIYNDEESELTCTNCDFNENTAGYYGGAIYNDEESELTCNNCDFNENNADYYGGAIHAVEESIVNCTSCVFTENAAYYYGGAIFADYGSIINCNRCIFTMNAAEDRGGAINNEGGSELTCTSCDFTENSAYYGGAIYNNYATATVIGSNFESNTAGNDGGAFHNYFGDFTLNFNRIVGNTAGRDGQDIFNYDNRPEAVNNALYNWWGSNDGPADGSIYGELVQFDPWLVMTYSADPTTIQQGETSTLTADFRYDSDGSFHDPALGHLPDGIPVTFTTDLGNVGSKSVVTYTLNGVATATLRGDEAAGVATTTANLDDQTLTTPVTIRAAGGGDGDNSTITANAATVGMQETGTPIVPLALAVLSVLGGLAVTRKKQ